MIVTDKVWEQLGYTATLDELPDPPTHCHCGRPLVRLFERDGFTAYGRESQVVTWRCPKTIGWLNRLLLTHMLHDEYAPDHFIDWHWAKRHYR